MILEMSPSEVEEFVLSQKVGRVGCHVGGQNLRKCRIFGGWEFIYCTPRR